MTSAQPFPAHQRDGSLIFGPANLNNRRYLAAGTTLRKGRVFRWHDWQSSPEPRHPVQLLGGDEIRYESVTDSTNGVVVWSSCPAEISSNK